ncbi:cellulose binding domain-containing protein [Micromonospora sp. NPDC001898]|uniref:cellulose binding domain-containing protein n=1 Tax=Micromonospora sp. NPDC001898 TaxID=3364221 RepID=UPI0036A21C84
MHARRVIATAAVAALLSLLAVTAAQADDTPALTTPGVPVVVVDEPHRLTLSWTPSSWVDEPEGAGPIRYQVMMPLGPHTYRGLGDVDTSSITLTDLAPGTDYRIAIQAYAIGGYSIPSAAASLRTVYGKAKVSYLNRDWSPTDNQAQFDLLITNTGTQPLSLTSVRVRYHMLFEGGNTSLVAECDWAELGCDRIRRQLFFFIPPAPPPPPPGSSPSPTPVPTPTRYPLPGTPAPGWVELTFTEGVLAPGASTGLIQLRLHRPNWSDIDERDDPSWRAATGARIDNSRITLDVGGVREFGDQYAS